MNMQIKLLPVALFTLIPLTLMAGDWAGFRGEDRTGVSKETGLKGIWPKDGLNPVWVAKSCGAGYSGPAVVNNNVYFMGLKDGQESLYKLDEKGKEVWTAPIGPTFDFNGNSFSAGPNSTPTVEGNLVFALGSQGILICADANSGKPVWKKNLPQELKAEVNPIGGGPDKMGWGFSWSPLIDGDKLICVPGGPLGLLSALNKKTGDVLWQTNDLPVQAPYSSPILAILAGQKTIVQITQNGCVGVEPEKGKKLWEYKRETPYPDVVCPTPVVSGDLVFTSVGFGAGSDCFKVLKNGNQFSTELVYAKKEIANDNGGIVLVGKHIYGFHLRRAWECLEIETGKVAWSAPRRSLGAGSVCAADGRLYLLTEDTGEVAMLAASSEGYKEISKFTLPELSKIRKSRGRIWTHPVISNGKLYIRDQELLYCFEIK